MSTRLQPRMESVREVDPPEPVLSLLAKRAVVRNPTEGAETGAVTRRHGMPPLDSVAVVRGTLRSTEHVWAGAGLRERLS